jgi:uncharacterized damage-inducible protein DinB
MILQALLQEFNYEAENTRKLLKAIPDAALSHRPPGYENGWTLGELAEHIVNIYGWYPITLLEPKLDLATFYREQYDINSIENILARFEDNVTQARAAMEKITEEALKQHWTMSVGDRVIIPPSPRVMVMRSFLMNHLYHHRGEMVVYLRSSGNAVPGLYGPTKEDRAV